MSAIREITIVPFADHKRIVLNTITAAGKTIATAILGGVNPKTGEFFPFDLFQIVAQTSLPITPDIENLMKQAKYPQPDESHIL